MEDSDFWYTRTTWGGYYAKYITSPITRYPKAIIKNWNLEQIDLVGDYLKLPKALQNP